jgi:NADPH2:quinone reductase
MEGLVSSARPDTRTRARDRRAAVAVPTGNAVLVRGYITDPSAPAGLLLTELPEPEPAPGEALVEVQASSVNRGELCLLTMRPKGWRPGQDLGGVVLAAAADGTGPGTGTRVVGLADGGAWAERVAVPTQRLASIKDRVSAQQAAALPVAGATASRALRLDGPLLGRQVLVTGATGGVGQFAVQLARLSGARVTGLVHGEQHEAEAKELGVDVVVTSLEDDRHGPFELVLDGVGGDVLLAALRHCAPRGTVVMYAGQSNAQIGLASFAKAPLASLRGFFVFADHGTTFAQDLATLARFVADGRLRPHLGLVLPWERLAEIIDALRAHRVVGKAVLTIS